MEDISKIMVPDNETQLTCNELTQFRSEIVFDIIQFLQNRMQFTLILVIDSLVNSFTLLSEQQ